MPWQKLSQQVSTATNVQATQEELLAKMFSMLSMPRHANMLTISHKRILCEV
jgi:hypothetical protein